MNRLVRGTVLLAAVAAIWSCEKDPTGANAKTISTISANPSVVFVSNVDSAGVVAQALNDLNQPDSAVFDTANVGPGLIVSQDTTYGHIIGGGNIPTSARFFVKGATPTTFVSSSFDITAGGISTTIPVKITPASLPGVFNTTTPDIGDTVTVTAPAPMTFSSATTALIGGSEGYILSLSADSSTLTFLSPPGTGASFTAVRLPYIDADLTLDASEQVKAGPATIWAGSDMQATAPSVGVPTASGEKTVFLDQGKWDGNCGGVPCQWYKLDVTVAGDYDFASQWDNTSDLGIYVFDNALTGVGACDSFGNDPAVGVYESCTITLGVGTYYIQMQNFAPFYPDPNPAWFWISMTLQ